MKGILKLRNLEDPLRGVFCLVRITLYDGYTTIGGNKIYVEEKGIGFFLDFGMNFAKYQEFFESFLSERDSRGIYDLINLKLIPKLKLYREDLIPTDLDVSRYTELNAKAVLLSHAHLDHCGNIGLLRKDIPIVASNTSIALLKGIRDTSQSRMGSDIVYLSQKSPISGGLVFKADGTFVGRDLYCTMNPSNELEQFLSDMPGKNTNKICPGKLCQLNELQLPFEIEAYEVDHSIYGATGFILQGDVSLAYTGDFRLHGKYADKTKQFITRAKDSSILIIEGTRAEREDINESEQQVFKKCLEIVELSNNRLIIADFSPRNFERLETFREIAEKTGRYLVITTKDAYLLHSIECADLSCHIKNLRIYNALKTFKYYWERSILRETGEEMLINPSEISKNPEKYILCFSFYDMKHLLDIKPDNGTYIYSSSEAFSEEQIIDLQRLWKWLNYLKFNVCGFDMVQIGGELIPNFIKGYHASGHASKGELREVIEKIDPDTLIPVHTTNINWFKDNFENIADIKENGQVQL